jgi:signal peptidase I
MSRTISIRRLVGLVASLALLASAWWFLAPPQLGGRTSYVFTDGVSMQPRFHTGDLAVVRGGGPYRVGRVVAYRNDQLGTVVLHRIVAIRDGRYFFKGDNNSFVDPDHPTRAQLVGALWLHIPGAYMYLSRLHSPTWIAILVAASVLLSLGGTATRRRRRRQHEGRPPPKHVELPPLSDLARVAAAATVPAAVALLAASLAVSALAFTHGVVTSSAAAIPYAQSGVFSYSARVRPSVAYPGGVVRNGDPIFLKLVRRLDVRFAYRFSSRGRADVAGTIALTARIASGSGWSRTVPLAPARRFEGGTATVAGTLDVARLQTVLASLAEATGVGDSYTLTLVPVVRVRGRLDAVPVAADFSPGLPFTVGTADLLPQRTVGTDATRPSASGSVSRTQVGAATVSVRGLEARVDTLRRGGLAGAAGSLALLLVSSGTLFARGRRRDEPARIKARYGSLIVDVAGSEGGAIEVRDMDALAHLAEQFERPILHGVGDEGRDEFSVSDDGLRYVYRPPLPEPEPAVPDEPPEQLTVREWMDRLGLTAAAVMPPPRRRRHAA